MFMSTSTMLSKLDYSYIIIAKETILQNEYKEIKKIMFDEFNRVR